MKTNHKKNKETETLFIRAACHHLNCKPDELNLKTINDGQEALVRYDNKDYKITTREALWGYTEDLLTDKDFSVHINLDLWMQATVNTVSVDRIVPAIVSHLENVEQAQLLSLALTINSCSTDKYQTFWLTLEKIDDRAELLGLALVSARQVYNGAGLIDDLVDLIILNGKTELNELQDGIFETIALDDDYSPELFIYSVEYGVDFMHE